jgi:hypothetical protein
MDANDGGFLLVLSGNAHFAGDGIRVVIGFPGWIAMVAAKSSPSTRMPSSPAARATSPGKPPGTVPRHVAMLAIAVAVVGVAPSSTLREALLAGFCQAIHNTTSLQVVRIGPMDRALIRLKRIYNF